MKCRACGYVSFEVGESCANCGAPGADALAAPSPAATAAGAAPRRRRTRRPSSAKRPEEPVPPAAAPDGRGEAQEAGGALELSEEDLEIPASPPAPRPAGPAPPPAAVLAAGRAAPAPALRLPLDGDEPEPPPLEVPIIDCIEEIPERFWAPDGASLLRRTAALLVDLALLALLLGAFLLGGSCALLREGSAAAALLSWSGLRAALLPVTLLGLLLSLVCHVLFHALAGATPGKRLAGLEVRSADGSHPTWGEAALRWLGASAGLLCAGAGPAWALFEPRRRGWADLLSRTLVVSRASGRAEDEPAPRSVDPAGRRR